jgi:Family of unknown function (DUF5752)
MAEPFAVKDCALLTISEGERAQNLRELRDRLRVVHPNSIYHHFWGGLLRPAFDDPEYRNDFAAWAHRGLHDKRLAERLGIIDPTDFENLEQLRHEILDVVEQRLDESEFVPWARTDQQFLFLRSQIVVFDTCRRVKHPTKMLELIPSLSVSSLFYHFVDARRRTEAGVDDISYWLEGFGEKYSDWVEALRNVDPYFGSLTQLRERLSRLVPLLLKGGSQ